MKRQRLVDRVLPLTLVATLAGCGGALAHPRVPDADPAAGRQLILYYGCVTCHVIGGIAIARGQVGPSLVDLPRQLTISGVLPNTIANLERWIEDPQRVVPGNIMPDLGVGPVAARNIVAYLEDQ